MNKRVLKVLAVATALSPLAIFWVRAQSQPLTATVISKEEIEAVSKAEQDKPTLDMNIKVVTSRATKTTRSASFTGAPSQPAERCCSWQSTARRTVWPSPGYSSSRRSTRRLGA